MAIKFCFHKNIINLLVLAFAITWPVAIEGFKLIKIQAKFNRTDLHAGTKHTQFNCSSQWKQQIKRVKVSAAFPCTLQILPECSFYIAHDYSYLVAFAAHNHKILYTQKQT